MNTTIFNSLINEYNHYSFTHEYIFGFADRKNIYMCFANSDILPYVCCLDKVASTRNGGYALRFKPNKAIKELLKTGKTICLCSESYFESLVSNSKYNRGEIFEKLVTEYFNQVWTKDNVPFTKDGDITVNGIAYQIKYTKATFCTESSIKNLTK